MLGLDLSMEGINRLHGNGREDLGENSNPGTKTKEQKPPAPHTPLPQNSRSSKAPQHRGLGQLVHSQHQGWDSKEDTLHYLKGSQEPYKQRVTHSLFPLSPRPPPAPHRPPMHGLCPQTLTSVYRRAGWTPCTAVTVSGSPFRFHSLRLRSS